MVIISFVRDHLSWPETSINDVGELTKGISQLYFSKYPGRQNEVSRVESAIANLCANLSCLTPNCAIHGNDKGGKWRVLCKDFGGLTIYIENLRDIAPVNAELTSSQLLEDRIQPCGDACFREKPTIDDSVKNDTLPFLRIN